MSRSKATAQGALFEVVLGGLVGLGVLYLWFTGLFDRSPESFAREFAGAAAIDCGTVDLRGDPSAVDRCVRAALSGTEPFYAWYYRRGIDSRVARGVARASDGVVYLLGYDGDPSGGAHVGAKFSTGSALSQRTIPCC